MVSHYSDFARSWAGMQAYRGKQGFSNKTLNNIGNVSCNGFRCTYSIQHISKRQMLGCYKQSYIDFNNRCFLWMFFLGGDYKPKMTNISW